MFWPYIILAYTSLFVLGLSDNIRGPLFPEILREFSLSSSQGSWFFALSSFMSFISSLWVPALMKNGKRLPVLRWGLVFLFFAMIGMGASTHFWMLLFFAVLFGLSLGFLGVAQNLMVSEGTEGIGGSFAERAMSGLHAMYGLASLLAPLLIAFLSWAWTGFTWKSSFFIVSVLPLILLVGSFFFNERAKAVARTSVLAKAPLKMMILAAGVLAFYVVAEILVSSRLALLMRSVHQAGLMVSSYYLTAFFVLLLLGRFMFVLYKPKMDIPKVLLTSLFLSSVTLLLGLYWHPLFLVLAGLSMAPYYPLSITWIASQFVLEKEKAIAIAMALQSCMVVIMHVFVGFLTDYLGIQQAFLLAPLFLGLSAVFYFIFIKQQKIISRQSIVSNLVFFICSFCIGWGVFGSSLAQAEVDNEVAPIVLRSPAQDGVSSWDFQLKDISARVDRVISHQKILAISAYGLWNLGEVVAVESKDDKAGIVAFVEVIDKKQNKDLTYSLTLQILRHSRRHILQVGDRIFKIDLSGTNSRYKGTTDLMIRRQNSDVSAKYRPLFTQGFNIGETAQTLWPGELLMTWYGLAYYGIAESWTMGSFLPANLLGAYNLSTKFKLYDSDANVFATGLSYAKIPNDTRSTLNLNLIWDSVSSETVISHTYVSIAVFTFNQAEDATAIRSLGTSSLQTGYEFILDDWNRVLVGPVYNFEKKALGGYLSYLKIWDRFHFALSVNSTNISSLKLSPQDGFYFFFDAYWRL